MAKKKKKAQGKAKKKAPKKKAAKKRAAPKRKKAARKAVKRAKPKKARKEAAKKAKKPAKKLAVKAKPDKAAVVGKAAVPAKPLLPKPTMAAPLERPAADDQKNIYRKPTGPAAAPKRKGSVYDEFDTSTKYLEDEYGPEEEEEEEEEMSDEAEEEYTESEESEDEVLMGPEDDRQSRPLIGVPRFENDE